MEQANHAKQRSRDAQISDLEIQVSRLTLQNTSLTDMFSQKEVEAVAEVKNLKQERDKIQRKQNKILRVMLKKDPIKPMLQKLKIPTIDQLHKHPSC